VATKAEKKYTAQTTTTTIRKSESGAFELPVTWLGSNQEDFWTEIYAFDTKEDATTFYNGMSSEGDGRDECGVCDNEEDLKLYNKGRELALDKKRTGYVPKVFVI
jgi:hypothetical protein